MSVAPSFAQTDFQMAGLPAEEMELSPLPPRGTDPVLDNARCGGDYFLMDASPNNRPAGVRILASTTAHGGQIFSFLKEKYQTLIDDTKKVPTIQYDLPDGFAVAELRDDQGGPRLFMEKVILTIRLSRAEYMRAAKCLPAPR